jgi:hypothetical protein
MFLRDLGVVGGDFHGVWPVVNLPACNKRHVVASELLEFPSPLDASASKCKARCRADTLASVGRCEMELTIRYSNIEGGLLPSSPGVEPSFPPPPTG